MARSTWYESTVTFEYDSRLHQANASDSRAVIGIKGNAKALSFDHKPDDRGRLLLHSLPLVVHAYKYSAVEKARIINAGGYVQGGRVNSQHFIDLSASYLIDFSLENLALSRALGDFSYKMRTSLTPEEQLITANRDVMYHKIADEDEFLVLACDGANLCFSGSVEFVLISHHRYLGLPQLSEGGRHHSIPGSGWHGTRRDNRQVLPLLPRTRSGGSFWNR